MRTPTNVCQVFKWDVRAKFPKRLRDFKEEDASEHYWCVSSKLVGECGHKHETEEDAQQCYEPMVAKWRAARGWK